MNCRRKVVPKLLNKTSLESAALKGFSLLDTAFVKEDHPKNLKKRSKKKKLQLGLHASLQAGSNDRYR